MNNTFIDQRTKRSSGLFNDPITTVRDTNAISSVINPVVFSATNTQTDNLDVHTSVPQWNFDYATLYEKIQGGTNINNSNNNSTNNSHDEIENYSEQKYKKKNYQTENNNLYEDLYGCTSNEFMEKHITETFCTAAKTESSIISSSISSSSSLSSMTPPPKKKPSTPVDPKTNDKIINYQPTLASMAILKGECNEQGNDIPINYHLFDNRQNNQISLRPSGKVRRSSLQEKIEENFNEIITVENNIEKKNNIDNKNQTTLHTGGGTKPTNNIKEINETDEDFLTPTDGFLTPPAIAADPYAMPKQTNANYNNSEVNSDVAAYPTTINNQNNELDSEGGIRVRGALLPIVNDKKRSTRSNRSGSILDITTTKSQHELPRTELLDSAFDLVSSSITSLSDILMNELIQCGTSMVHTMPNEHDKSDRIINASNMEVVEQFVRFLKETSVCVYDYKKYVLSQPQTNKPLQTNFSNRRGSIQVGGNNNDKSHPQRTNTDELVLPTVLHYDMGFGNRIIDMSPYSPTFSPTNAYYPRSNDSLLNTLTGQKNGITNMNNTAGTYFHQLSNKLKHTKQQQRTIIQTNKTINNFKPPLKSKITNVTKYNKNNNNTENTKGNNVLNKQATNRINIKPTLPSMNSINQSIGFNYLRTHIENLPSNLRSLSLSCPPDREIYKVLLSPEIEELKRQFAVEEEMIALHLRDKSVGNLKHQEIVKATADYLATHNEFYAKELLNGQILSEQARDTNDSESVCIIKFPNKSICRQIKECFTKHIRDINIQGKEPYKYVQGFVVSSPMSIRELKRRLKSTATNLENITGHRLPLYMGTPVLDLCKGRFAPFSEMLKEELIYKTVYDIFAICDELKVVTCRSVNNNGHTRKLVTWCTVNEAIKMINENGIHSVPITNDIKSNKSNHENKARNKVKQKNKAETKKQPEAKENSTAEDKQNDAK